MLGLTRTISSVLESLFEGGRGFSSTGVRIAFGICLRVPSISKSWTCGKWFSFLGAAEVSGNLLLNPRCRSKTASSWTIQNDGYFSANQVCILLPLTSYMFVCGLGERVLSLNVCRRGLSAHRLCSRILA